MELHNVQENEKFITKTGGLLGYISESLLGASVTEGVYMAL